MNYRLFAGITSASVAMLIGLSACSESESGVKVQEQGTDVEEVSSFDDLPNCTSKREGDSIYVKKDALTYVCKNGDWSDDDVSSYKTEDDLPNCTAKREGEHAYIKEEKITLVCKGEEWVEEINSSSSGKNGKSSSSGEEEDESASSTLKDSRDGKIYKITKIGNQVWMAENLNYDGGSWYCPSGARTNDKSCKKYGKLYGFSGTGVGSLDNLCPDGWVVPNTDDWNELIEYVDAHNGKEGVGKSLKATVGWYEEGYQQIDEYSSMIRKAVAVGEDQFGFSALPAGSCWSGSCYTDDETRFWTASGYGMKLSFDSDSITLDQDVGSGAAYISLRCVRDVVLGSCGKDNAGEIKEGHNAYICDNGEWRPATNLEMDIDSLGKCTASLEGGRKSGNHGMYVCKGGKWHDVNGPDILFGTCDEDNDGTTERSYYDGSTYICDGGEWRLTKNYYEEEFGLCNEKYQGRVNRGYGNYGYEYRICNDGGWESATYEDYLDYLGPCNAAKEGVLSEDGEFRCRNGEWGTAFLGGGKCFSADMWGGCDGLYQVPTGLGNETKTFGYWFGADDRFDEGLSRVVWPTAKGNDYDPDALDPIIDMCGGVCGTASLSKGSMLNVDPYVVVGFNVVGETSETNHTAAAGDASAWGGICVAYSSDVGIEFMLGQGDEGNSQLAGGPPSVILSSGIDVVADLSWSEFEMPAWAISKSGTELSGVDAAKHLVSILFKIQNKDGDYQFNIKAVGRKGTCKYQK